MEHTITGMTRETVACSCRRVIRLPEEYHNLSKSVRDDKLLDLHAMHVAARQEQGR
jgi:hypothetical protein